MFLFSTPDAAEPGVHAGHYEDDLLSPLPRHAIGQTVRQLLHQRHEGLSGQPGRPQHRVEASGRWAARARYTQFGHMSAPRSLPGAQCRRTRRKALLPVFYEGKRLHSRALLCLFVDTMMQVADRFNGPSGVDNAILSLPNHISEAMMTMIENIDSVNSKVRMRNDQTLQICSYFTE